MVNKEADPRLGLEPYAFPAMACTLFSTICFISGAALGSKEIMIVSCFIWGAGVAFWHFNGLARGVTPWPRNAEELTLMVNTMSRSGLHGKK